MLVHLVETMTGQGSTLINSSCQLSPTPINLINFHLTLINHHQLSSTVIKCHQHQSILSTLLNIYINSYQLSSATINSHHPSSILINSYQLSSTTINSHPPSSILINSHQQQSILIILHQFSSPLITSYQL